MRIMRLMRANKCRRGLTLIETIITLALLVVLMGFTFTMLFTGSNTYAEQANYGLSKQIGDGCLKWLEHRLCDAQTIRFDSAHTAPGEGEEAYFLSADGTAIAGVGRLYWRSSEEGVVDIFGENFYHGRSITLNVQKAGSDSVFIKVTVLADAEEYEAVYSNSLTLRLLNYEDMQGGLENNEAAVMLAKLPAA